MSLLRLQGMDFVYPGGPRALRGVSLEVAPHESIAILGRSGAGKSTLAMVMADFVPRLFGGSTSGTLQRAPSSVAAMVFDDAAAQLVELRPREEVRAALRNRGIVAQELEQETDRLLTRVGLHEGLDGRWVWELSQSEKQRLALAACLARRPDLLVLDNITSGQDAAGRRALLDLIENLSSEMALAIIDRDLDLLRALDPRVAVLEKGEIVHDGALGPVLDDPALVERADLLDDNTRDAWRPPPRPKSSGHPRLVAKSLSWNANGTSEPALASFDIELAAGEVHAILGATNSCKSLVCRLLCGLEQPDSGDVLVDGESILATAASERASTVATVLANPDQQLSCRTVAAELAFPLRRRQFERTGWFGRRARFSDAEIETRCRAVAELANLEGDLLASDPLLLPFADRKLVTVAAALTVEPRILILDEPAAGLGRDAFCRLRLLLARCAEQGVSVLFTGRDVESCWLGAHGATILDGGKVVARDRPERIAERCSLLDAVGIVALSRREERDPSGNREGARGAIS